MKRIKLPSKYRLQGLQNMIFISGMLILRILLLLLQMILCSSKQHKLVKKNGAEFSELIIRGKGSVNQEMGSRMEQSKIEETVNRLVNPLDNAINEKCSRIMAAFLDLMDEYQADYYIINSHVKRHQGTFYKIWFERLKIVNLPRELVVNRFAL